MRARQSRLRWTIQKMKCHQKPEMRCGGDADCKKYELFQNNPQTKKRSRDQKWLHTATRKNHISNRMRRIIIHTGIFTYESAGQWNVPGNQRRWPAYRIPFTEKFPVKWCCCIQGKWETAGRKNTGTRNRCHYHRWHRATSCQWNSPNRRNRISYICKKRNKKISI